MFRTLSLPAIILTTVLQANNIQLSNAMLTANNSSEGSVHVQFDLSWENSWRTTAAPANHDAAWVFVKYRDAGTGLWQHARLHDDAGHSIPPGSVIATGLLDPGAPFDAAANWGVGVFLHRASNGSGTFAATAVELRWNYGQNGIAHTDIAEVRVFAIEMVHVPQGAFFVGCGGVESYAFKNGTTDDPFPITGEGALDLANVDGQLWAYFLITEATLPAPFPKGHAAAYVMKHGIAQQDYVDFLNTLTREQQDARTVTDLAVGTTSVTDRYVMSAAATPLQRNGISCSNAVDATAPISFFCDLNGNGIGGEPDDGQWVGANHFTWQDVAAYLDWSGLRPMTELEYEKTCRGPITPVPNEYAWGNANVRVGDYTLGSGSTASEVVTDPETGSSGNALSDDAQLDIPGPGRVGFFATSMNDRIRSGAGHFGVLDLSGGLYEFVIYLANPAGRAYTGTHGDGALAPDGQADAATWPLGTVGFGRKGGAWGTLVPNLRVSNRFSGGAALGRSSQNGGRGTRTAP